jgi:hypothetical protein
MLAGALARCMRNSTRGVLVARAPSRAAARGALCSHFYLAHWLDLRRGGAKQARRISGRRFGNARATSSSTKARWRRCVNELNPA